eukprot:3941563-Rhodomonas_salina.1
MFKSNICGQSQDLWSRSMVCGQNSVVQVRGRVSRIESKMSDPRQSVISLALDLLASLHAHLPNPRDSLHRRTERKRQKKYGSKPTACRRTLSTPEDTRVVVRNCRSDCSLDRFHNDGVISPLVSDVGMELCAPARALLHAWRARTSLSRPPAPSQSNRTFLSAGACFRSSEFKTHQQSRIAHHASLMTHHLSLVTYHASRTKPQRLNAPDNNADLQLLVRLLRQRADLRNALL